MASAIAGDESRAYLAEFPFVLRSGASETIAALRTMAQLTQPRFSHWLAASHSAEVRLHQLTNVVGLFNDWPNVWWDSLDRLVSDGTRGKDVNIARVLRRHREMLSSKSRRIRFLQESFVAWATKRRPDIWKSPSFRSISKVWQHEQRLLTTMEAAACLKCATPAIRKMVDDGLLTVAPDNTGSKRLLITVESVIKVQESRWESGLNWKETRKILKCDARLICDPWFREVMQATRSRRGTLLISRDRVEWLFDQLDLARGSARQLGESSPVGLRAAVVICKPLSATYASILSWVLDGSLPAGGFFRKQGLRSLWFHKEDLRSLITKMQ